MPLSPLWSMIFVDITPSELPELEPPLEYRGGPAGSHVGLYDDVVSHRIDHTGVPGGDCRDALSTV